MTKTHLKSSPLPTLRHCTEELPPILRLRRLRLRVFAMSFKRKNDVTMSYALNGVIFELRELLFDISHFFRIDSIGEVC